VITKIRGITLLYDVVYAEFYSPFLAVKYHFLGFDEIKLAGAQESIDSKMRSDKVVPAGFEKKHIKEGLSEQPRKIPKQKKNKKRT
jgi:hypothetical protein